MKEIIMKYYKNIFALVTIALLSMSTASFADETGGGKALAEAISKTMLRVNRAYRLVCLPKYAPKDLCKVQGHFERAVVDTVVVPKQKSIGKKNGKERIALNDGKTKLLVSFSRFLELIDKPKPEETIIPDLIHEYMVLAHLEKNNERKTSAKLLTEFKDQQIDLRLIAKLLVPKKD